MAEAPDDQRLVARARRGDEAAFGLLVRRYERSVYALCHRYLGAADAADAAQETFVRAFTRFERFDPARPLLPWLLTIARHQCVDELRSRGARAEVPAAEEPAAADLEAHLASRQELAMVTRSLSALPEGPREALALFHGDDLSYQEVADHLDVPIGTVMTWIHRGRAALRRALAGPGASGRAARPAGGEG